MASESWNTLNLIPELEALDDLAVAMEWNTGLEFGEYEIEVKKESTINSTVFNDYERFRDNYYDNFGSEWTEDSWFGAVPKAPKRSSSPKPKWQIQEDVAMAQGRQIGVLQAQVTDLENRLERTEHQLLEMERMMALEHVRVEEKFRVLAMQNKVRAVAPKIVFQTHTIHADPPRSPLNFTDDF
jgi:hypothetical protein